MPELLLRFLFFTIAGILAYDITHTGSLSKSQTYQALTEKGAIKKSFNKAIVWVEKKIPVYYNQYFNSAQYLLLVTKNKAALLIKKSGVYYKKNFPSLQKHVLLKTTKKLLKKKSLIVSKILYAFLFMVAELCELISVFFHFI